MTTEMRSIGVVVEQPGVQIGLQARRPLVEPGAEGAAKRLIAERAIEARGQTTRLRLPDLGALMLDVVQRHVHLKRMTLGPAELAPVGGQHGVTASPRPWYTRPGFSPLLDGFSLSPFRQKRDRAVQLTRWLGDWDVARTLGCLVARNVWRCSQANAHKPIITRGPGRRWNCWPALLRFPQNLLLHPSPYHFLTPLCERSLVGQSPASTHHLPSPRYQLLPKTMRRTGSAGYLCPGKLGRSPAQLSAREMFRKPARSRWLQTTSPGRFAGESATKSHGL